jgi:hypothetical protein
MWPPFFVSIQVLGERSQKKVQLSTRCKTVCAISNLVAASVRIIKHLA